MLYIFTQRAPDKSRTRYRQRDIIGPDITKKEVIYATKIQKDRKATDPDNTHAEVLKLIADEEEGVSLITKKRLTALTKTN